MTVKLQGVCIIAIIILQFLNLNSVNADGTPDQTYHPKVIPPAPSVSSLGKYGNVPVNLSTGAANVTIPLFELKCKSATVPIGLSYSSNGIKVDAVASWVGMEWSLNAGGVISRTVRGGPDETSHCELPYGLENYSPSTVDFLLYHWDNTTDTEPDIFHYNFDGYSGKFIIDVEDQMKIYTIPHNNLKIDIVYPQSTTDAIFSFIIRTPDGNKYTFGENYCDTTSKPRECNYRTYSRGMKTAWHLTKIEYPTGEKIQFFYKTRFIHYYSGISQTIKKLTSWSCLDNSCPGDEMYTCTQYLSTKTCHLEKIITSSGDSVVFFSTGGRLDSDELKLDSIKSFNSKKEFIKGICFNYDFHKAQGVTQNNVSGFYNNNGDLKYRMFLTKLEIGAGVMAGNQMYQFDYYNPTSLPGRLSFAQDHWGYYNAENNFDFVVVPEYLSNHPDFMNIRCNREPNPGKAEAGLLKQITYPTKGTSAFEYEQNTYAGNELVYPPLVSVSLDVIGQECYDPDTLFESFTVPFSQDQIVNATLMFDSTEFCGFMKNRHIGKISIYDNTASTYLVTQRTVHLGHPLSIPVTYDSGHVYTIRIIAHGAGTETSFSTGYYLTKPYTQLVNKYSGGMRIKRIIDFDCFSGKTNNTRYYYGDCLNLNVSSGVTTSLPRYNSSNIMKLQCGEEAILDECRYMTLHSSSVNDLYGANGNSIMYSSVVKSFGENFEYGGEANTFLIDTDDPGMILTWSYNDIIGSTQNNTSWNNGRLDRQLVFRYNNSEIIPISQISNSYRDDSRRDTTLYGYVFRKCYSPLMSASGTTYTCSEKDVNKKRIECTTNHNHNWYLGGPEATCIAWGANNHIVANQCEYVGQILPVYTALDNYDGFRYEIYIKWNYLESTKKQTFSFSGQDSITETTYYKYFNPIHALPNLTKLIDSRGDTIKNITYYPLDYSISGISTNFQSLVDSSIIGVPIDQRQYVNANLTSGQTTKYNGFGQPVEVYQAKNELGSNLSFNRDNPYSYGVKEADIVYSNETHNIKQYQQVNNIPMVYLWAYHHCYPIAEIAGATYSDVEALLAKGNFPINNLQESYDDTYITNATNYVRTNIGSAMVVSYTYKPQVGMTSKTDAAGIKTTYEYDSMGRLSVVKDAQSNIVKKYDYHYASQNN